MPSRARGEGSYRTRKDGRVEWRGWVDTPTGRIRKSVFGANKRACAARVLELHGKVARHELVVSDRATVKAFAEDWLERARTRVRPSTVLLYERLVNGDIIPKLGHHRLARLRRIHVVAFVEALTADGRGPRTVGLTVNVLKVILNNAIAREALTFNPALRVPLPRPPAAEPEPLDLEQIRALLKAAAAVKHGMLIVLATTTGMRQGELLGLRWEDVDLEARTLEVRHTLSWLPGEPWQLTPPKSDAGRRTVSLPKAAVDALNAQDKVQKARRLRAGPAWQEHGLVFTGLYGLPLRPNEARRTYARVLKAVGIPHRRFHSARHDAVGLLLEQGVPLTVVRDVVGHSSVKITGDVYGHLADRVKVQASDAMDRALGAPPPRRR